jgi:hypothetical protein
MPEPTLTPFEKAEQLRQGFIDSLSLDRILREASKLENPTERDLALDFIATLILKDGTIAEA